MSSTHTFARALALVAPTLIGLAATSIPRSHARPAAVFASGGPVKGPSVEEPVTIPEGTYAVAGRTGAAELSIPVPVPPGRLGMQPELRLSYSSQGETRGGIAAGWTLSGIPSIRVDTSLGRLAGLHYRSSLAGGQRLVEVDEPGAPTPAVTFRAEHDDGYARYEYYPSPTDAGSWRVLTTDGRTLIFGDTPLARDEPSPYGTDTGSAARWFLTTMTDRFGNEVRYRWAKQYGFVHGRPTSIDIYLQDIEYTYNDAAGLGPHARISLVHGPALDLCPQSEVPIGARFDFRTGIRIFEGANRLDRIETWVDSGAGFEKRHELALSYDATALSCALPRAPLRLLVQVSETAWAEDGTPSTKPPSQFTYARGRARQLTATMPIPEAGHLGRGRQWMSEHDGGKWPATDAELRDLDGDGRMDWLRAAGAALPPSSSSGPPPAASGSVPCGFDWEPGGSGVASWRALPTLPWGESTQWLGESCSLSVQLSRRSTRDHGCAPANYTTYRFMDFDGDGRGDLVTTLDYSVRRYRPSEDTLLHSGPWGTTPLDPADQETCLAFGPGCKTTFTDVFGFPAAPAEETEWSTAGGTCPAGTCIHGDCVPSEEKRCACRNEYCPCDDFSCEQSEAEAWESGILGERSSDEPLGAPSQYCPIFPETQGHYYRWRIHRNLGDGTFAEPPELHLSPVPLEGEYATSSLGGLPDSSWHGFADLDGDGCVDALWQTPPAAPWGGELQIFRGNCRGRFEQGQGGEPHLWPAPTLGERARVSARRVGTVGPGLAVRFSEQTDTLVDINGDGLADFVTNRDEAGYPSNDLVVYYNTGFGFENTRTILSTNSATGADTSALSREISLALDSDWEDPASQHLQIGYSRSSRRDLDIDEDGLVDVIELPPPLIGDASPYAGLSGSVPGAPSRNAVAHINVGDRLLRIVAPSLNPWNEGLARIQMSDKDEWIVKTDFRDLDGDGRPELYKNEERICPPLGDTASYHLGMWEACGVTSHAYTDPAGDRVAGLILLERATLATGAELTFAYAPSSDATVVVDDPAAGRRVASPLWVVASLTVDPRSTLAAVATTNYLYRGPILTRDRGGRIGFRGFEEVEITGPPNGLGQRKRVLERYNYAIDHSGRLADRVTFDGGGRVVRVDSTAWRWFDLFSGRVRTFHPAESRIYTCDSESDSSEAACRAGGTIRRTVHGWRRIGVVGSWLAEQHNTGEGTSTPPDEDPGGFQSAALDLPAIMPGPGASDTVCAPAAPEAFGSIPVMVVKCGERLTDSLADTAAGDRTDQREHQLRQGLDTWHLLGTSSARVETRTPCCGTRLVSRTATTYDAAGLGLPEQTRQWIDGGANVAVTTRTFDPLTGLTLTQRRPEAVATGSAATTQYAYGPFAVHVATTTDPLGHVTETEHDLATGLVTGTANAQGSWLVWQRTEYDGFGRAVRRWRDVDASDDASTPYALRLHERIAYCDLEPAPRIRREKLLAYQAIDDWPADGCAAPVTPSAVVSDTYLDGLGRVERTVVYSAAGTAVTQYVRDAAGNVRQLLAPNPADGGVTIAAYTWEHDTEGRVTRWAPPAGTGVPVVFAYDGLTSSRTELAPTSGVAAPVAYEHDVFGRLRQVIEEADDGPAVTSYTYDGADRMARIEDADGTVTLLEHDLAGRRVAVERNGRAWRYHYDLDGNMVRMDPPPPESSAAKVRAFLDVADATLTPPMALSDGPMISVPQGTGPGGSALFRFRAPVTGDYAIWGRGRSWSAASDSFNVQVDGGPTWYWIVQRGVARPTAVGWDRVEHHDTVAGTNTNVLVHLEAGWHDIKIIRREPGTELYRLLVTNDLSFVPSGEGEPAAGPERIWLEAEAGALTPPMASVAATSGVSGGAYVRVPQGNGDNADPDAGGATELSFSVARGGRYYLWGRVANATEGNNSFFVRFDDQPAFVWETPVATGYWWEQASSPASDPQSIELAAGVHTLRIAHREDGARLDKLLITNDAAYVPSGIGAANQPLYDPATIAYSSLWSYDAIGRPTSRWSGTWDLGADDQQRLGVGLVRFHYGDATMANGHGRLTRVERPWGTTSFAYTAEGWIAEETHAFEVNPFGTTTYSDERTVRRAYDPLGQPLRVTQPADGAMADVTVLTTYDRFGLPSAVSLLPAGALAPATPLAAITRNAAGVATSRATYGATTQTWTYDAAGRVIDHDVTTPAGVVVAGETLVWDDTGNVQSVTAAANGRTITYGYDAQHQLRTATADLPAHYTAYFGYSPAGRVLAADVSVDAMSPGATGRNVEHVYDPTTAAAGADPAAVRLLRSVDTGATFASYDYDSRGNLVRRTEGAKIDALIHDGDNQLREVISSAGGREVHYYTGEGERLATFRVDEFGDQSGRVWIGDTEIEYDGAGPIGATVYPSLGGQPVARVRMSGATPTYDLMFHGVLGSLLAVLEPSGAVQARTTYGPYGELLWQDGPETDEFTRLYNGKELDEVSGLSYYGYRYYDRLSMSWTQADPLFRVSPDLASLQPRRASLYTFSLNAPVRYRDPDGRNPDSDLPPAPACDPSYGVDCIEEEPPPEAQVCTGEEPSGQVCDPEPAQAPPRTKRHGSKDELNVSFHLQTTEKLVEYLGYPRIAGALGLIDAFVAIPHTWHASDKISQGFVDGNINDIEEGAYELMEALPLGTVAVPAGRLLNDKTGLSNAPVVPGSPFDWGTAVLLLGMGGTGLGQDIWEVNTGMPW